ncbi:MAG: hypothetical protein LBV41_10285 [Cytophagaceae bacterium]|jgi:hypothetical protein|nr:hypothetical protein [Cytophagaceae bacterium]
MTLEANIDSIAVQNTSIDDFNENTMFSSFKLMLAFSAFAYSSDMGWVILNPYFIKLDDE